MSSINNFEPNLDNKTPVDKSEQLDHIMSPFNKKTKERALTSNKNEGFSLI
jgi:hypothetical protein